jgi:hypothetical protein
LVPLKVAFVSFAAYSDAIQAGDPGDSMTRRTWSQVALVLIAIGSTVGGSFIQHPLKWALIVPGFGLYLLMILRRGRQQRARRWTPWHAAALIANPIFLAVMLIRLSVWRAPLTLQFAFVIAAAGQATLGWLVHRDALTRGKRIIDGKCIECGYDLRATPDRCPECGKTPPPMGICGTCRHTIPTEFEICPYCRSVVELPSPQSIESIPASATSNSPDSTPQAPSLQTSRPS